jgi:hypothetical protein
VALVIDTLKQQHSIIGCSVVAIKQHSINEPKISHKLFYVNVPCMFPLKLKLCSMIDDIKASYLKCGNYKGTNTYVDISLLIVYIEILFLFYVILCILLHIPSHSKENDGRITNKTL